MNNTTYFYQELPMAKVIATEKELEKRLYSEELNLATKCSPCPAFITLNLKNGDTIYVARETRWIAAKNEYELHVQILEDDENNQLQVIAETRYMKSNTAGLTDIAAQIIRLNRR